MNELYFGYGGNRDPKMIEAICGRQLVGRPASVTGYELCVQRIDQVPRLPQTILRNAGWKDDFQSYVLREAEDPDKKVYGMLWELTSKEREHIRNWELIPEGWYTDHNLGVELENGTRIYGVETEIIIDQPIDRIVETKKYQSYLMGPKDMQELARKVRQE